MKYYIFIALTIFQIGCHGQTLNITEKIIGSKIINLPIADRFLSTLKGDSLNTASIKKLSSAQYSLIIKDKELKNPPLSFENTLIIGQINLSDKFITAVFRNEYNPEDYAFYLCNFNKKGELLSALIIDDIGNTPDITSTINKQKVISIRKEFENKVELYEFVLQENGIFKRIQFKEEEL